MADNYNTCVRLYIVVFWYEDKLTNFDLILTVHRL